MVLETKASRIPRLRSASSSSWRPVDGSQRSVSVSPKQSVEGRGEGGSGIGEIVEVRQCSCSDGDLGGSTIAVRLADGDGEPFVHPADGLVGGINVNRSVFGQMGGEAGLQTVVVERAETEHGVSEIEQNCFRHAKPHGRMRDGVIRSMTRSVLAIRSSIAGGRTEPR